MKNLNYLLLFLLFITIDSFSLPRFALREAAGTCLDCHVNPTGGNMRNIGGWVYGKNFLSLVSPREDFKMSNKIGENIQFGLDFRGQLLGSLQESTKKIDFQRMTGSLYTNVDLSEKISVFFRYDFIQSIYEGYGIAHILPNNSYIKGGTFQPNFGIRVDDHTAYTRGGDLGLLFATGQRQGLIYDPRYTESGVELGFFISDFAFLTASVGNPRQAVFSSDPTYTANLMFTPQINDEIGLFFGGSYATFKGSLPPSFTTFPKVNMYGGYAGIGIGGFSLMGEYDIAKDYMAVDAETNIIMVEAAFQFVQGVEAVVRYDSFEPNKDVENDEVSRIVFGFELFPYSFIEIRPQFRLQMEDPSVENNSFVVQMHLWY